MGADEIRGWWPTLTPDQQRVVGAAAATDRMDAETLRVLRDTSAPLPHLGDSSVCHTTWAFGGPARAVIERLSKQRSN